MPIQLPDLLNKKYQDILDEMIASIPKYTNKWTNFNPSDPGITILEFLAWVAENILYRINRVPYESYINFLRLVAGVSGINDINSKIASLNDQSSVDQKIDPVYSNLLDFLMEIEDEIASEDHIKKSISEIKKEALTFLESRYRAVTKKDFQLLAIESTKQDLINPKVARVIVSENPDDEVEIIIVSNSYSLDDYTDETDNESLSITSSLKGYDSIDYEIYSSDYPALISYVKNYLDPRKLIGTIIKVEKPQITPVRIEVHFTPKIYATPIDAVKQVTKKIKVYLFSLDIEEENHMGWSYNNPLTIYGLAHVIEEMDVVDHVDMIKLNGDKNPIKITGLVQLNTLKVTALE